MWSFGTTELIQTISALMTFLAILVSLYLANKSKTLKFKIFKRHINKKLLEKEGYHQIVILNNGHIKFTITSLGYYINKKYYYCYYNMAIKKLDSLRHTGNSSTGQDHLLLPTYLQEGECIDLGLFPHDFNFIDSAKNKKVYYYIMINNKVKKIYSGLRENEFYNIVNKLTQHSLQHSDIDSKPRTLKDIYFRI